MRFITSMLAISALAMATASHAADNRTKEDIVQAFIKSANLGKSRAICIGSKEECSKSKPATVDMRINFEYNSAELTPDAKETIRKFAAAINDYRLDAANFKIEGHTDAFGGDEFNMTLSSSRAKAVTNALVSLGVKTDRIDSKGYGEGKPIVDDPFDASNRRVDARIVVPGE